jgi:aminobenzoyl-glutamate utilization protein B
VSEAKQTANAWVDEHRDELSAWNRAIWEFAEPAWREYRSAAWYVERLRAEGFEVEAGSGGMPTAFSATWSHRDGPTVLSYAEYDAVPGNSQAAATREGPRPGTSRFAAGHTDPHSALGIGSLAGLLATKAAMERHGIAGTLRYTGEPAEKVQGSKVVHGLRGYYDGVDAILSFHPFYILPLCNTVRWDTQCGAYYSRVYSFIAREAGEWSPSPSGEPIRAAHSSARAPGANVALAAMLSATKATQESMLAHIGGWSMNEAILSAGNFTADNLPAPLAQVQYAWRVPDVAMAESVLTVLEANARHAAAVAHCDVLGTWVARNRAGITTTRSQQWSGRTCKTWDLPGTARTPSPSPARSRRSWVSSRCRSRSCPPVRSSSSPRRRSGGCAGSCPPGSATGPRTTTSRCPGTHQRRASTSPDPSYERPKAAARIRPGS